ncbi:hypothetical protein [Jiulongibacter sediminis]|uniref:Serine kinase n=1 Tax=Jiulongibacter sediminis TaxID=1605367 RepID=A0A0P7BY41_9BACT|nr:hypothetical protein [Jiulongibacter sediminis]KPM49423.1 hypothetical protein AFM12_02060 [Jiulongibacter sediminis]TBX26471.1 hypothetical protein TK44_02065 [Jiulongibacter sediminis]
MGINSTTYKAFGLCIQSDPDLSDMLPMICSEKADLFISETTIPPRSYEKTQVFRKDTQAEINIDSETVRLHWPSIATFEITEGQEIRYQSYCDEPQTLKLFLLSEAIGIALFQLGFFMLHASAVKIKNKAHLFLGEPGAGKSTMATAFWQAGFPVLTDDLVALKIEQNNITLLPAFPQFKVWQNALDGLRIDLKNLKPSFEGRDKYLITQDFEKFEKKVIDIAQINILNLEESGDLPTFKAPIEFLKHFPLPNQLLSGALIRSHFQDSITLSKTVKINLLKRPEGFENLKHFVEQYAAQC